MIGKKTSTNKAHIKLAGPVKRSTGNGATIQPHFAISRAIEIALPSPPNTYAANPITNPIIITIIGNAEDLNRKP